METKPINVAVSVLADISLGIYRTPANALKELINNAFDADAKKVVINTGFPNFFVITCRDDGKGLSSSEFERIMNTIGGSTKRLGNRQITEAGRPIIGKIGIGILAVAQICKKFTIISTTEGSSKKFEAVVDFSELGSEKAKTISLSSEAAREIGNYTIIDDLPEDPKKHYTKIILEEIDQGFRRRLSRKESPDNYIGGFKHKKGDPQAIDNFIKWLSETNVRDIPDYYRLLWELSITCPLPYYEDGPIAGEKVITQCKDLLTGFDFSVEIDGLELYKIIRFPNSEEISQRGIDYEVYSIDFDQIVNGKRLAFTGYIYHQRISICPSELRGLLIRVRNVAIGSYDKSLLNYPKSQGPRISGISGEIYIIEGLEDALNVDRNSFRETDPHFIKLQEFLYQILGGDPSTQTQGIFSDISRRSFEWNRSRKANESNDLRIQIIRNLNKLTGKDFSIQVTDVKNPVKPVEVDFLGNKIVINQYHSIFPRSRNERISLEKFLIAYEYANEASTSKNELSSRLFQCLEGYTNERDNK